ncbi:DUF86 domain-containing protein [Pigmentiphaga sp. CHJ604]|uniref:HepT-like ribonuclease domain-containing protein n=1 Tax=Pigmentiphaga sp. CHJ604 TaxID=3081984 RepID=UPI0030D3B1F3
MNRLSDYLDHMHQAAVNACAFTEGMSKDEFLTDRRTQQAVVMSLIIIGEAVTKIIDHHASFAAAHPEVPWRNMRAMRNRMAHGYFDIDLGIVWDTVKLALPTLLLQLGNLRDEAGGQ